MRLLGYWYKSLRTVSLISNFLSARETNNHTIIHFTLFHSNTKEKKDKYISSSLSNFWIFLRKDIDIFSNDEKKMLL